MTKREGTCKWTQPYVCWFSYSPTPAPKMTDGWVLIGHWSTSCFKEPLQKNVYELMWHKQLCWESLRQQTQGEKGLLPTLPLHTKHLWSSRGSCVHSGTESHCLEAPSGGRTHHRSRLAIEYLWRHPLGTLKNTWWVNHLQETEGQTERRGSKAMIYSLSTTGLLFCWLWCLSEFTGVMIPTSC